MATNQVKNTALIYKFYFVKIKNFCLRKDIINKEKSQYTKWENIFAVHVIDKEILHKVH